jgi:transcriptional regulator GlxA family with amidase domain
LTEVARLVAKKMVVYHRRAGGQSQYSALLELEPRSDRIQSALTYAKEHLDKDTSASGWAPTVLPRTDSQFSY